MKFFLPFLFLPLFANAGWVSGTIHVRDDNPKVATAIFVNSYTGIGPVAGRWYTIDLTSIGIPVTAKSVFISGILIITHGMEQANCNLTVTFRAPGDNLVIGNYIGQVTETDVNGGQRSTMSLWTPVRNGKIEFAWNRNTFNNWPVGCSYGMNLSAGAFVD